MRNSFLKSIVVTGLMAFLAGNSLAAEHSPDEKLREAFMKSLGGHMGAIGTIMKHKMNKPDQVAAHAEGILAVSSLMLDMFPKGSEGGDAKPEIWKKWSDFEKKAADFKSAADALSKAAKTGDAAKFGPAIGKLGESCKGCHDSFKKDDKK